ncbi:MAG: fatty acid CoA ligase family protein [Gemmataceae bacterium]
MATLIPRMLEEAVQARSGFAAIVAPSRWSRSETWSYERLLDASDRLSASLVSMGVGAGMRVAVMAPPSPRLFATLFALFRLGAVAVMVDPGMGLKGLKRCLREADCQGFIGSPKAMIARAILGLCPGARIVAHIGNGWLPGYRALVEARSGGTPVYPAAPVDMAAILYTSGSTGPAKGAVYSAGTLAAQVVALRDMLDIQPGEVDLSTFPLFGLYAPVLRMTAVIPIMDFTRPASVDAGMLLDMAARYRVDNLFASPAVLTRLAKRAEEHGGLDRLKRIVSAGAPVPWPLVRRVRALLRPGASLYTPYGMTEALPIACPSDSGILGDALERTRCGGGIYLGKPVPGIRVTILPASDEPLGTVPDSLPSGAHGEIAVTGPQVTRSYWRRPEADSRHKMTVDGEVIHRTGDLGYLDSSGDLWYLGRQAQAVRVGGKSYPADACEAVFLDLPGVSRVALVQAGPDCAALVVEPHTGVSSANLKAEIRRRAAEVDLDVPIFTVLIHGPFPVDRRHNSKIDRETLGHWAASQPEVSQGFNRSAIPN